MKLEQNVSLFNIRYIDTDIEIAIDILYTCPLPPQQM